MNKMLVVEDDTLTQKMMGRIFQGDFEIDFCESVAEYYEKYSNTNYNIIIMDVSLQGGKNGLELIKEIKGVPSYKSTPILCLTAHSQPKMRKLAIRSGAALFITKPVSNSTLKEAVGFLV
ncbi:MAG: response regulator [Ignavibacteriaceae bacterium]